jgi:hypothetical protein
MPEQLFDIGVTVILAVRSTLLVLTAVKLVILPVPEAANPMEVLVFVQLNCVLAIENPENVIGPVCIPAQMGKINMGSMVGIGLTVIENTIGVPEQVLEIGVTVNREVTGTFPLFWPVNAGIFPVPLSAMAPIGILVLTH